MNEMETEKARAADWFRTLRDELCAAFEKLENTQTTGPFADPEPGRFERRATNTRMPAKAVPAFREFIEIEGQAFLERVDAWLSEHELEDSDDSKSVRLGLGAYWIEGRKRED